MLAEILGLATDTVIIIILMIKKTMPKPDLDLSGFPLDAWHLHPGLDRSCNGSEQSGSATSAETEGEQGVYPSSGSWGRLLGLVSSHLVCWWNTGSTHLTIMESRSNTRPKSGDFHSLCFLWQHKSQGADPVLCPPAFLAAAGQGQRSNAQPGDGDKPLAVTPGRRDTSGRDGLGKQGGSGALCRALLGLACGAGWD